MRIAIVGGGLAGALLALRLSQLHRPLKLELFTGGDPGRGDAGQRDASAASGGMVRAFERDPGAAALAAESLAELRGSRRLREWSRFRESGAVYVTEPRTEVTRSLAVVEEVLPGSAERVGADRLARDHRLGGLPPGVTGIVEHSAGYISPDALRTAALGRLADSGVQIHPDRVTGVTGDPAVRLRDGVRHYEAVVVAAGAWTPCLLCDSGLPSDRLRVRQIQYTLCRGPLDGVRAFVEENSGLYGRPHGPGRFLLGLPSDRWDLAPDAVEPDRALADEVVALAGRIFGVAFAAERTVASFDCYRDPPGLELRPVEGGGGGLFTFTGGSGGAAKAVFAASRRAARSLLG
ncbi:FAD-dependent oxidoreductase [Actinomadura xylanilytica]|uniref:FAD-dependent oxidoreductase n=1 Tax=Actinomadura xylanilytica TaxID=887459 RepID=UPI00255AFB7E|nr:FAD-dependent oxidoreductase [Actinomadura xylanilytica]MDL4774172.1 FAD-dependent oxidoreductase [Actinomadura xylanilytica]